MCGYVILNVMAFFNTKREMNSLPCTDTFPFLTYEFICFVQPGKQFLTVVVIYWDAHEVALADEIWLGAGVAGIQYIGDTILSH